ncbi:hypothetical protein BJV78DRAFT_1221252 [Lactifluus subvellereus]|nr:hypothetical protein BJV78DRAFT_1221252 [Lactifluus subvellereus]
MKYCSPTGDSHNGSGILKFQSRVEETRPGIFTHAAYINPDSKEDQRATFFGDVDEQVELVAQQLKDLPQLSRGFDAIGSSQGTSESLLNTFQAGSPCAYVERHNDTPIRNLITFGSQHMGISDIPPCKPYDLRCQLMRKCGARWRVQRMGPAKPRAGAILL